MGLDEMNSSSRGFISQGYCAAPGQIYPTPGSVYPAAPGQIYSTPGSAYPQQSYSASAAYASSGYSPAGYPFPSTAPHSGYGGTGATIGGGAAGPFGAHHVPHGPGAGAAGPFGAHHVTHGARYGHSHGHYGGYSRDLEE